MTGEEIKSLLATLGLGTRHLAAKLGVDATTVQAWTREEQFPTKRHVDAMRALQRESSREREGKEGEGKEEEGKEEEGKEGEGKEGQPGGERGEGLLEALADPALWTLLRKVLAYPKLRQEVEKAAAEYRDPARSGARRGEA